MKKFRNIIILIILAFLIYNCKKTNDVIPDKYFTDLHDTLFEATDSWPVSYAVRSFDIDFDKDSVIDISIKVSASYSSSFGSESFTQVIPKNGFEIDFSSYIYTTWNWHPGLTDTIFQNDTVMIPKVFNITDTISINNNFTNNSLMIGYSESPGGASSQYVGGIYYGITANKYEYIAFRKKTGNSNILAWLKVKVKGSSTIILNSCRYVLNENTLIIN